MKTIYGASLLAVMLIMPPAAGYAQEQSPKKTTQDSGAEVKTNSPSLLEGITETIKAQKDNYQKEIQDQIQNKVKFVEDKANALKSLGGKAEPEKPAKQETTLKPAEVAKEGPGKKPASDAGQPANAGSGLWGKLNALYAATTAFLNQLLAILLK
jgi:hypothetical protein